LSMNKRSFGKAGERYAAEFLKNNNYKILEKNYRYGRMGEIDIIARENEYICFIEVKSRSNTFFGLPCEAVAVRKQRKIRNLAYIYLKENNLTNENVRFDIVEVILKEEGSSLSVKKINLIKNAF
jgi:putative endonuclease